MKRKINCETARNFSVEKALEKLGHFPKKTAEKEAWFLSPFRSETQASFKVSKTKNRWYDHGEGIGGNVIDLVCRILKCSIQEALEFLNDDSACFSFQQQRNLSKEEKEIQIVKVQEIQHPALIQYLSSRGICITVAKTYTKEVWYANKNVQFFAIGLQNHENGWELRNKIFKNGISPKSYTCIRNYKTQLIILEGMFDLLSLAVLDETQIKVSDIIVLNSLAFIKNIETLINNYELVHLYLDNDAAGREATSYLTEKHNAIIDQSESFKDHKDLNTFLCHERKRSQ